MIGIQRGLEGMKPGKYRLPVMPQSRRLSLRPLERIASYVRQDTGRSKCA